MIKAGFALNLVAIVLITFVTITLAKTVFNF
jgi:sodium-dependent dicarboxylate transporter 2/3/5